MPASVTTCAVQVTLILTMRPRAVDGYTYPAEIAWGNTALVSNQVSSGLLCLQSTTQSCLVPPQVILHHAILIKGALKSAHTKWGACMLKDSRSHSLMSQVPAGMCGSQACDPPRHVRGRCQEAGVLNPMSALHMPSDAMHGFNHADRHVTVGSSGCRTNGIGPRCLLLCLAQGRLGCAHAT